MKHIFSFSFVTVIALLGYAFTLDPSKGAIEIKKASIDVGIIKEGTSSKVGFEIKNISKNPVRIFSVTSTCGCTVVEYPKSIAPNQQIIISATFNSKGFVGPVKKELVMITNDSVRYYKMELLAKVVK